MDIAAYMTWIGTTIKKMGGMLACDLAIEETNPEGHYFVVYNCYDEQCSLNTLLAGAAFEGLSKLDLGTFGLVNE